MTTAVTPTSQPRGPSAASRPGVSIVVPCFNEAEGLAQLHDRLLACEQRMGERYDIYVVLVDDASTDQTWELLQQTFGQRRNYRLVRHMRNAGIAAGIMTGLRHAPTEIVCSIDADCTYDPLQIETLLQCYGDGVDVVTASPYHPEGRTQNLVAWRLAISRLASLMYWLLMGIPLHTYTSCFRVYRRRSVLSLPLRNSGFVGVPELLWRVKRAGGQVVECPAVLTARLQGQSKMRLISVSLGHFSLMCRIILERIMLLPAPPSSTSADLVPVIAEDISRRVPAPSIDTR